MKKNPDGIDNLMELITWCLITHVLTGWIYSTLYNFSCIRQSVLSKTPLEHFPLSVSHWSFIVLQFLLVCYLSTFRTSTLMYYNFYCVTTYQVLHHTLQTPCNFNCYAPYCLYSNFLKQQYPVIGQSTAI